jgi:competence protein ComEC
MKLPAVAVVTAFASGIAIGFWPVLANNAASPRFLASELYAAVLLLVAARFLLSLQRLPAAVILAAPLRWLSAVLLYCIKWMAHIPRLSYRIQAPPMWLILSYFCAAALLALGSRFASVSAIWCKRLSFALLLAAALLIAIFPFAPRWQRGSLELTVLDVRQGDSLFLVSPPGHTILVDAGGSFTDPSHRAESRGPDPGEDAVSPYLWSRGFKQIDIVALTHAH